MQLLNIAVFLPLVSAYAIPLDTRATTSNPCAIVANYTVVSGDTLSKIATAYNSTVDAIVYVNPSITNANLIYPDEVIAIPSSDCNSVAPAVDVATEGTNTCAPAGTAANYTVKSGDTLTDIASSYNLTLAALEAANPQIANFDVIDVGQVINIPVCEACTPTYTIKSGDTLTNIASSYGITLAALEAANPQIANFDLIYPDQVINIPCTATCTSTYTVVSGDYLSKIADNHNVTLAALEAANPQIANFDLIQPGDVINIPTTCAAASNTCTSTYTVVSGDYLSKIADNHNVTLAALEAANPQIANFDLIQPGDVINIPTTCAATTPVVTGTCAPAGTAATYTVKSGDYLSLIASNYNITLAALEAVNPQIANFDLIQPGDVINIPVCGSTAESTTSTGDDVCE